MASKKRNIGPVSRTSADLPSERVERLRELFPDCVAEGKVDFEKLKAALGEIVDDRPERYSFTWAGKRDAVRLLQVPSRATLKPRPDESVDWETTKNVFIEGENLEVLKLLYKSYAGKVKMIYIDPPYNTGNDFIYPDNFADPLDTYLKLTGQKDSEGNLLTSNPETSGRYHSAWLSMMYPRLFVARQLLREDGVIFVSIDDHELANLDLLMREIFGEENSLACFARRTKAGGGSASDYFAIEHDYVLAYARSARALSPLFIPHDPEYAKRYAEEDEMGRFFWDTFERSYTRTKPYTIVAPDGTALKGKWFRSEGRFKKDFANGEIRIIKKANGNWSVQFKQRLAEGRKLRSLMNDNEYKSEQAELDRLGIKGFPHPKPVFLLKRLMQALADDEDVVMDFFAGSCTTAQALLELNREDCTSLKFVMVQLQEQTTDVGASGTTIADIGKERIRRVIKKLKAEAKGQKGLFKDRETPEDLGFRVYKLAESSYRQWRGVQERDGDKYAETMEMFIDPLIPGWKPEDVIWEVALKEGYSLSSTVEELKETKGNTVWRVTDPDSGQSFRICLDNKLKEAAVKALALRREEIFICRDAALTDEQAANLALQCRLKTI